MILVMLYVAVLVAGLAPESGAGRALRRLMLDLPRAMAAWFTSSVSASTTVDITPPSVR